MRALLAALEEPRKVDRINEMGLEFWFGRLDTLVPKIYLITLYTLGLELKWPTKYH